MHGMKCSPSSIRCKGLMALVLGVLFMLGTTGVWPEFTFVKYWPLFLILGGLHATFCPCVKGNGGSDGECCKK